jgi:uncharacterized protein (TIGR03437 family)
MVNLDQTFNSSANPAPRNSCVACWLTGQGDIDVSLADGVHPTGPAISHANSLLVSETRSIAARKNEP